MSGGAKESTGAEPVGEGPGAARGGRAEPRILHVITTLDRGGAEKALLVLCGEQAARGGAERIAVAYLKGRGELAPDFRALGVAAHDLDVRGVRAARAHRVFDRLRREFRPDLVHSHLFKADVLAATCLGRRRAGRTALVSTKHNQDVQLTHPLWRVLGRAALSRADACVAVSDGVAAHLRATVGEPACGIDVIRYGVAGSAAPICDPPGASRVLCVGRLEPQKDPLAVVAAFRGVLASRPAQLVFLGRGALEPHVREALRGLPPGAAELRGFADDPTPHVDAADVVVLGSRWEGLPLALVEAALRARPVVATAVGGVPEIVEDGVTGLLVPHGDARAMTEAIVRLLGDPSLGRRMGRAARERALERFGALRCADEHDRLYRRALGSRR